MASYRSWFLSIATALGDDEPGREFHRYKISSMIEALNAALCLVGSIDPDSLTEYFTVKLKPGSMQDLRGCCTNVLSIVQQVDNKGNVIKTFTKSKKTQGTKWRKPSCLTKPGAGFVINDWDVDPGMNGRFTVEPPIPCGVDVFVTVKCVSAAGAVTEETLDTETAGPCVYMTAAWHFVLARMLAGDRHAAGSASESMANYKLFFDILGIEMKSEKEIENAVR